MPEIPHDRIPVAEIPRLREFSSVAEVAETSGSPNVAEFAKIREFGYMNLTTFSYGEFISSVCDKECVILISDKIGCITLRYIGGNEKQC